MHVLYVIGMDQSSLAQDNTDSVPAEIKLAIISQLVEPIRPDTVRDAMENVKAFLYTKKSLAVLLSDKGFIEWLINYFTSFCEERDREEVKIKCVFELSDISPT
jgi:hypothetical protein